MDRLEPLSARSVALSLLIGTRPPRISVCELISMGEMFGISAPTMRVAVSRMVTAGDLVTAEGAYTLAPRHLERQARTEAAIHPRRRPYSGLWRMAVVVGRGRSAAQRTSSREYLTQVRFAELREGVWLRPDNLENDDGAHPRPPGAATGVRTFTTRPDEPGRLCRDLWDLDRWAADARGLLGAMRADRRPADRLAAAAAAVRHLRTDPALPDELAPDGWPAEELRRAYEDYRTELTTHLTVEARA
jgi:phenylacetic acid degradation operon negative regulatory protein